MYQKLQNINILDDEINNGNENIEQKSHTQSSEKEGILKVIDIRHKIANNKWIIFIFINNASER